MIMERKFITKWQYEPSEKGMEHPEGVINTVPDQSMSIREILQRFRRGVAPPVVHQPLYDDDDNWDTPEADLNNRVFDGDFDLTDREALTSRIKQLEAQLAQERNAPKPADSAGDRAAEASEVSSEAKSDAEA